MLFLVPVELWTSTELPPPLLPSAQSTDIGGGLTLADLDPSGLSTIDSSVLADLPMSTNPGGCDIDGEFYMDGMKVSWFKFINIFIGIIKFDYSFHSIFFL